MEKVTEDMVKVTVDTAWVMGKVMEVMEVGMDIRGVMGDHMVDMWAVTADMAKVINTFYDSIFCFVKCKLYELIRKIK